MTLASMSGCASQPSVGVPSTPTRIAILATTPATLPIDATSIFAMTVGEASFDIINQADASGCRLVFGRTVTTEHAARIASNEGDRRIEYLRQNDDGSIALTAAVDRDEDALTLFEPPLIICPASLHPGEVFSSETSMRVVAMSNPRKQRERGAATRTIAYLDDATIGTPRGQQRVARIDIHFRADLRFADADERTTLFVSRDDRTGLVAQDTIETVTILGAFPRENRRTLVRDDQPAPTRE